jgi:hypothetical protein
LGYPNEVVHEDIDVCDWALELEEWGSVLG